MKRQNDVIFSKIVWRRPLRRGTSKSRRGERGDEEPNGSTSEDGGEVCRRGRSKESCGVGN